MFAIVVAASGLLLHRMKQRSEQASDMFDPDAVHDATIVSEMVRVGSMKSISSSQNLSSLLNTSSSSSSLTTSLVLLLLKSEGSIERVHQGVV